MTRRTDGGERSAGCSSDKMRRVAYLVFAAGLLQLCRAYDIPCTVTQDARGTVFSIPEFQGIKCYYSWNNGADYVLANNGEEVHELVVFQNNRTLLIKEYMLIVYRRDCSGEAEQGVAVCTYDCSGNGRTDAHSSSVPATTPSVFIVLFTAFAFLCLQAGNYF